MAWLRIATVLALLTPATFLVFSIAGGDANAPDAPLGATAIDGASSADAVEAGRSGPHAPHGRVAVRSSIAAPRTLVDRPGTRIDYRVQYDQRTAVADLPPVRTAFSGTLERITLSPRDSATRLIAYRLRTDSFALGDAAAASVLAPQFAMQTIVETDRDGRPVRYYFDPGMHAVVRMQLKAMLELGQVVTSKRNASTWRTEEVDMTGRYKADYAVAEAIDSTPTPAGVTDVAKTVRGYTELWGEQNREVHPGDLNVARTSAIRLHDASRSLLALEAESTVTVTSAATLGRMRVHATLSMAVTETGEDPASAARSAAACRELLASLESLRPNAAPLVPQIDDLDALAALAEGHTVAGLIDRLTDLMAKGEGESREAYEAMEALAALITLDDENAVLARDAVLAGTLLGDVANFVAGALGSAGTPAAQQMLSEIATNTGVPPGVRLASLMSLQIPSNPTPTAVQTVRTLANQDDEAGLGRTALLAYGTMASRLQAIDPSRAKVLSDDLLAREAAMVARGDADVFLDAIGNAGVTDAYPTVARYLASGDPALRAHAVGALQHMSDDRAAAALRNAFADPDAAVRRAALETAAARSPTQPLADRVIKTMLFSSDPNQRKAAVSYLADATHLAGVRQALTRVSRTDGDPALRTLAKQALGGRQ